MDLTVSELAYIAIFVMTDGFSNFGFPYFVMYIRKGVLAGVDWSPGHSSRPDMDEKLIVMFLMCWVGVVSWKAWALLLYILTRIFKTVVPAEGNIRQMIEGIVWTVNGLWITQTIIIFVYACLTLKSPYAEETLTTLAYSGLTALFIISKYFSYYPHPTPPPRIPGEYEISESDSNTSARLTSF